MLVGVMGESENTGAMGGLPWHIRIRDIGDSSDLRFEASDAQCKAFAEALDILSVEALTVDLKVRVADGARVHVNGKLSARLTQACVVSLDPVPERIDEQFRLVFWPRAMMPPSRAEEEVSPFDEDTPEPYDGDRIEIGQLIFELVASNLNPYPRVEGAALEKSVAGTMEPESKRETPESPFSALQRLKDAGDS